MLKGRQGGCFYEKLACWSVCAGKCAHVLVCEATAMRRSVGRSVGAWPRGLVDLQQHNAHTTLHGLSLVPHCKFCGHFYLVLL
jgi:hypothetical protein